MKGKAGIRLVDNLSLDVRAGEIVCIYGLMGAGRTKLMECVAGRLSQSSGTILLEDQDVSSLSISQRIASGLALVPEDRQRDGLVQTMSVGENLTLSSINTFIRGLMLSARKEKQLIADSIRTVTVKTAGERRQSVLFLAAINKKWS